jgi:L-serine dehydratase
MAVSVFDLFSIGIGPSSSHTVGPMRAARRFVERLASDGLLDQTSRVKAELFGSLGATGHGHGSDKAVLWGLEGEDPETIDTRTAPFRIAEIAESARIRLNGTHQVGIHLDNDVILHRRQRLPYHPNGMTFAAFDADGSLVLESTYYSIGGGFIVAADA